MKIPIHIILEVDIGESILPSKYELCAELEKEIEKVPNVVVKEIKVQEYAWHPIPPDVSSRSERS